MVFSRYSVYRVCRVQSCSAGESLYFCRCWTLYSDEGKSSWGEEVEETKCCRFIHLLMIHLHLQSSAVFILLWSTFSQLTICSINIENGFKNFPHNQGDVVICCVKSEAAEATNQLTERRWISSSSWCDVVSSRFDSWIISPTSSSTQIMSQGFISNLRHRDQTWVTGATVRLRTFWSSEHIFSF